MRAWLAVVGILALTGCNPVSCSSKASYATDVSVDGQKALGEAMQLMQAGHLSAAIERLTDWDRKAAETLTKIEQDPMLSASDRKELQQNITELRERVDDVIHSIAAGDQ